jgi:hypothetical protein
MKRDAISACTCILFISTAIICGCQTHSFELGTTVMVSTVTISPIPPITITITPLPEVTIPPPITRIASTTLVLYPPQATVTSPQVTITTTYTLFAPASTVTVTRYPPPITIFTTQTNSMIGPVMLFIDSLYGTRNIQIEAGKILHFTFSVSGSEVRYWVLDPKGNPVFIGSDGSFVGAGEGTFLTADTGSYQLVFGSNFQSGPSIIALYYSTT